MVPELLLLLAPSIDQEKLKFGDASVDIGFLCFPDDLLTTHMVLNLHSFRSPKKNPV